jgi:hypothetical protein
MGWFAERGEFSFSPCATDFIVSNSIATTGGNARGQIQTARSITLLWGSNATDHNIYANLSDLTKSKRCQECKTFKYSSLATPPRPVL